MTDIQIFDRLSKTLGISARQIQTVITLLDEGATVPFLARYRKEVTDGLDEEQIRLVRDAVALKRSLEERREAILKSITDQGKLTPELEKAIHDADDLKTLEDLYLPYKPKRKTKASVAKEKGLEPLALLVWEQKTLKGKPEDVAKPFVNKDLGVKSVSDALQGASDICAEWISENIQVRDKIREDFPILKRTINGKPLVYFDNAATSQTPQVVIDAIVDYYSNYNANIHRGVHTLSQEATDKYEEARIKVQQHFHAKHARQNVCHG